MLSTRIAERIFCLGKRRETRGHRSTDQPRDQVNLQLEGRSPSLILTAYCGATDKAKGNLSICYERLGGDTNTFVALALQSSQGADASSTDPTSSAWRPLPHQSEWYVVLFAPPSPRVSSNALR